MKKILYHGSNSFFEEFDPKFLNSKDSIDQYGSGYYFFEDQGPTIRYGEICIVAECDIKKVLPYNETRNHSLTFHQVEELILKSPDVDMRLSDFGDIDYEGYDHVLSRAAEMYFDIDILDALNKLGNDFFPGEDVKILFKHFIEMTGFNCLHVEEYGIWVMFDKNDIEIKETILN